jgi:hypothetical protein
MTFVRILEGTRRGDRELGRIAWDGARLYPEPAHAAPASPDELSPAEMLDEILATPIIAPSGGSTRRLTAADGPAFLEGLRFQYRGAYLRATKPEGQAPAPVETKPEPQADDDLFHDLPEAKTLLSLAGDRELLETLAEVTEEGDV